MGNGEMIQTILLLLKGEATYEQEEQVRTWLEADEENRLLYRQISETYYRLNYSSRWRELDSKAAFVKVNRQIQKKGGFTRWRMQLLCVAALIVICLGIAFVIQYSGKITPDEVPAVAQIPSGEMKAMLTLANGTKVELNAANKVNVDLGFALAVEDSVMGLRYQFKDSVAAVPDEYNTLTVPRSGEYIMVLGDGSRVWLNSETELKYPVAFGAAKREVYLTGEAYFEVAKDTARPFIVHTPQTTTTVLGTSFNVMAYRDEEQTEITLVTGAVAVNAGNHKCRITPGYQVSVDNRSLDMLQKPVRVDFYTSWKNGLFDFEGMTLEELSVKLSRWYDVDFFFVNREAAEKRFTGAIKRNNSLQFMLDFIQKTSNVRFEINQNTVRVYNQY